MSQPASGLPPVGPWSGSAPVPADSPGPEPAVPSADPWDGVRTGANPFEDPDPGRSAGSVFAPEPGMTGPVAAGSATVTPTRAPVGLLYASMGVSLTALVLAALFEQIVPAVIAWALAGLVGVGLTAVYLMRNARRQASAWYVSSPLPARLYALAVVVALAGVVGAAIRIALFVGRM